MTDTFHLQTIDVHKIPEHEMKILMTLVKLGDIPVITYTISYFRLNITQFYELIKIACLYEKIPVAEYLFQLLETDKDHIHIPFPRYISDFMEYTLCSPKTLEYLKSRENHQNIQSKSDDRDQILRSEPSSKSGICDEGTINF